MSSPVTEYSFQLVQLHAYGVVLIALCLGVMTETRPFILTSEVAFFFCQSEISDAALLV